MSNPFNTLPFSQLETLHEQMIGALIDGHSLPCRLVFTGTKFEDCSNCTDGVVVVGNRGGNPYYGGGGTGSGPTTKCPVCNGSAKIPVEVSENVNLIVDFNYKKFLNFGENVPEGDATTICKKELTAKLKNAAHIIFDTDIEKYNRHKFVRISEPLPFGLGKSPFILTVWKKA